MVCAGNQPVFSEATDDGDRFGKVARMRETYDELTGKIEVR
jgi:hypothetical protein